jgi:hypothetical protein
LLGLRELGFIEGRDCAIEERYADGNLSRLLLAEGSSSLATAKALGIAIPPTLLVRADGVIE